jgi:hypothetical protein
VLFELNASRYEVCGYGAELGVIGAEFVDERLWIMRLIDGNLFGAVIIFWGEVSSFESLDLWALMI